MKRLIALAGAVTVLYCQAQIARTGTPEPLLSGTYTDLYNPVLSADGSKLLFSSADYSNLRIHDFESGATSLICSEARSGLDAQFSADGTTVVYVSQQTRPDGINMRRLRSYDVNKGTNTNLSEPARAISRPVIEGSAVRADVDGKRHTRGKNISCGVRTEGATLYITVNGKETAYTPIEGSAGYIWASLSPDNKKVMFYAAGHGIVVTDLSGNIIARPGNYEAPVWYGNDHIVAMNATDDGHQYSSSQIVLMTLDGKGFQELTRPESMTMFPTASETAGKVVYSTVDGRLYRMSVTLTR